MSPADWMDLVWRHLSLSLLAVGGAITLAPALHDFHVREHHWLSDGDFAQAVTLAQAAPGPNALFIALLGWQAGLATATTHGAGPALALLHGLMAALLSLAAILLPSSLLTLTLTRWTQRHRQHLAVRAFRQGMSPLVIGVLLATSTLLLRGQTVAPVGAMADASGSAGVAAVAPATAASGAGALAALSTVTWHHAAPWAIAATVALLVLRSRVHMLWLLGAGALAGGLGWL
ncbi:chromate transporter [Pseudaquabacterium rugosum]|uniref:Chromate transporter n=1 Tax=Pseudaquabacterium rugosum TaxID=2984194 RepID=A0ABU9BEA3_9BURK